MLATAVRRYRRLVAIPGVRVPLLFSVLGSMPVGISGLAVLLLAEDALGSFAAAGRVVGAFGLASAVGAIGQGRLMDRFGQRPVLRVAAGVHLVAVAAVTGAADLGGSAWALAAAAACAGATLPNLTTAMRSLWATLVVDPEQRQAAYALGPVAFELSFVSGTALVAGVVALTVPEVALLLGAVLAAGAATGFTATAVSRAWRGTRQPMSWLGPLTAPGMRSTLAVLAVFGVAVGVVQVAVPALATDHGSDAEGGILLTVLSVGGLVGGLVYGARSWPGSPPARLVALLLWLGVAFAVLALTTAPLAIAPILLVCGLLSAPTSVVGSTLLDTVAPAGTLTEAFAAMLLGIIAGNATGNALGGWLVEAGSYSVAVLVAGAVATAGAGLAFARRRTLAATCP